MTARLRRWLDRAEDAITDALFPPETWSRDDDAQAAEEHRRWREERDRWR